MGSLPLFIFSFGFLFLIFQVSFFTIKNARKNYLAQMEQIKEFLTELSTMDIKNITTTEELKIFVKTLQPKLDMSQQAQLSTKLKKLFHARRTYNEHVQKMPTKAVARMYKYKEVK